MLYKDAAGREIQVGDVVVHFYVSGHAMGTDLGIVRELTGKTGRDETKLRVDSLRRTYPYYEGEWGKSPEVLNYGVVHRSIKVPEYCVVVEMTPQELLARYVIGKGETNADDTAEDKDQFGGGGLTPRSLR